jgi:hypothetical protein
MIIMLVLSEHFEYQEESVAIETAGCASLGVKVHETAFGKHQTFHEGPVRAYITHLPSKH